MAYIPLVPLIGTKYTLTGPNGAVAVFNDSSDPNYAGVLTDITGLDSPDVREVADDLVQQDGGIHGDFWLGRRPITMTGQIVNFANAGERALRMDRIQRASMALRGDAELSWTVSGVGVYVPVRRQQPVRFSGAWAKDFQIALVSQWATIFSAQTQSVSGNLATAENRGSYPSAPKFKITGPSTNPQVQITGAGSGTVKTTGLTLAGGEWVEIDCFSHTAVNHLGQSQNSKIDFAGTTSWPILNTGNNTINLTGGGTIVTTWRDTWA